MKVGILISGRGSNMEALIRATALPDHPAKIVLVVANRADAGGLATAAAAGIATAVIDHRDHADRAAFEAAMDGALRAAGVELVCLAGFMRILGNDFVNSWRDRLVNIHPSLLPAFKGLHVHERALDAGVRISGCTVHYVRPEMDSGPIIAQAAVPVADNDTPDSLAARILAEEHRIYPAALRWIAEGRVSIYGERVRIRDSGCGDNRLLSPEP
ncbi:phosphoribosylglycinamide formyltransferase [Oceanibacterium hippocampi]|uniref:Phosphoribosylglycinamide formyltransferase n=1 Tax=Oceanibacterium hippocampi TaxID=745714 RepID=A0A1Y5SZF9_9PROT|nr:phosphoribosylglycinamide formyltransferase [Oceanibacterium hippocampi]SLN48595.1 Phosphoribosylglycinamide formyltransferase [Oceanibacterium hippocampi]